MASEFAAFSAATFGIAAAVSAFGQLEQTLRLTNSVAQGTAEQLKAMDTAVRDLALGFKYSASEGASALYFLASAGFSVTESMHALTAVVTLSQATLSDLATTSDTLANTLSAFSLSANDAMRVANLFAAAISVTQATMDKLAYSIRYVGPIAASTGASIDETVIALSALYNAGNRGQQAGTLLRDVLVRIINPSSEAADIFARLGINILKADGSLRNFVDVLKDLSAANLSTITLAQIFQQRGVAGAATLLQQFDETAFANKVRNAQGNLTEYGEKVKEVAEAAGKNISDIKNGWDFLAAAELKTNFATKLALEQVTTLAGSFQRAKNAVTEIGISIGEVLAPGMTALANSIVSAVRGFRELDDGTKKWMVEIPLLIVAIVGIGRALQGVYSISSSVFGSIGTGISRLGNAVGLTSSGAVAAPIAANTAALNASTAAFSANAASLGVNTAAMNSNTAALAAAIVSFNTNTAIIRLSGVAIESNTFALTTLSFHVRQLSFVILGQMRDLVYAGLGPAGGAIYRGQGGQFARGPQIPVAPVPPPGSAFTNVPPPIVTGAGTAAAGAAAAAGAGASAAAAAGTGALAYIFGTVVPAVLTVAALTAAAYALWPFIKDLFKETEHGKTTFPAIDYGPIVEQQIQSIQSTPGSAFDKSQIVIGQLDDLREKAKVTEAIMKGLNTSLFKAQEELRNYLSKYAAGAVSQFDKTIFAAIQKTGNLRVAAAQVGISEENMIAFLKTMGVDSETAKKIQARVDSGELDVKHVTSSLASIQPAYEELLDTQIKLVDSVGYESSRVVALTLGKPTPGTNVVIIDDFLKKLQNQARDTEVAARKAEAQLRQNPLEQFIVNLQTSQLQIYDKMIKEAEEAQKALRLHLANKIETDLPEKDKTAFIGQVAELLTFSDFVKAEDYHNLDAEGKAKLTKGVASLFKAGATEEDLIESFNNQIKEFDDHAKVAEGSVKQDIIKSRDAIKAIFTNLIQEYFHGLVPQEVLRLIDTQRQNRDFIVKLRDSFIGLQDDILSGIFAASDSTAFTAKLQLDLNQIFKKYADASRNVDDEVLKFLHTAGYFGAKSEDKASIKAQADIFEQQIRDTIDKGQVQAVKNAITFVKNAQLKMLGDLRVANLSTFAQRAALQGELVVLLASLGLTVPTNVLQEANEQVIRERAAHLQQLLEQYQDQLRKVQAQIAAIESGKALGPQGALKLELPIELVGGPIEQMSEVFKRGAASFESTFSGQIVTLNKTLTETFTTFLDGLRTIYGQAKPAASSAAGSSVQASAQGATANTPPVVVPLKFDTASFAQQLQTAIVAGIGFKPDDFNAVIPIDKFKTFKEVVDFYAVSLEGAGAKVQDFYAKAALLDAATRQSTDGMRQAAIATQAKSTADVVATNEYQKQLLMLREYAVQVASAIAAIQGLQQAEQKYVDIDIAKKIQGYKAMGDAIQKMGLAVDVSSNAFLGLQYAIAKGLHDTASTAKLVAQAFEAAANSIASNLTNLITGQQKDWHVAMANIARDIANTILKALILKAIYGIFAPIAGVPVTPGLYPNVTPTADGNAYGPNGEIPISRFAAGDIVLSPTFFQYGGGGNSNVGLMGEAGPEAVMPLVRGSDGKLGVRQISSPVTPITRGGGDFTSINVSPTYHFHDGGGAPSGSLDSTRSNRNRFVQMQKELDREIEAVVVRVSQKYQRSGGFLNPAAQRLGLTGPQ